MKIKWKFQIGERLSDSQIGELEELPSSMKSGNVYRCGNQAYLVSREKKVLARYEYREK